MNLKLHDAEITGMDYDRTANALILDLAPERRPCLQVIFEDCITFRATDFTTQNVIYRAVVLSLSTSQETFQTCLDWLTARENESIPWKHDPTLEDLKSGNVHLATFDPSVGASLMVLFKGKLRAGGMTVEIT